MLQDHKVLMVQDHIIRPKIAQKQLNKDFSWGEKNNERKGVCEAD